MANSKNSELAQLREEPDELRRRVVILERIVARAKPEAIPNQPLTKLPSNMKIIEACHVINATKEGICHAHP